MNQNNRFFLWIRSSLIVRGDDRWIGGVCSGLAQRLGWSPTLVRALMVASVLLFGFGAALYAIGWLLLPDARTGHILIEDLIAGHWQWECLGGFLCLAVAVVIPWGGLFAIVLAALTLWFLVQSSIRQQQGYGYAYRGGPTQSTGQGTGHDGSGQGGPGQGGPDPSAAAPTSDGPATPGMAGTPGMAPAPGMAAGPSGPSVPPWQSGPAPAPYTAPIPTPAPAAAMPAPAPYSAGSAKPHYARRKPAGPLLVLVAMGLTLLSGAIVAGAVSGGYGRTDTVSALKAATIWSAALCLVLGAVLVVLGARGRRTGGLHPLAWLAAFIACCMLSVTVLYGAMVTQVDRNAENYVQVQLGKRREVENGHGMAALQSQLESKTEEGGENYWVADASPQTMDVLSRGVFFEGDGYDSARANIDLTGWGAWRDGGADACPVGQINLAVRDARVQITLPDSCRFVFGTGYNWYSGADRLGDAQSVLLDNGDSALQFLPSGDPYGYEHKYGDPHYAWLDDRSFGEDGPNADDVPMDKAHYLFVNLVGTDHGSVTVRYASDSTWPGYVNTAKSWSKRFHSEQTRDHLAVAEGKETR